MLFNSLSFLIFFPIVTALYFACPHRFRWIILLVSSGIFYMAFIPQYILILFVTIMIDYIAGIIIEKEKNAKKKKKFLKISIISTCMVLFIFKYFNFFNANFAEIYRWLNWDYPVKDVSIILPIGLSFHTFQSLSYVIEVYRGKQKPERNFFMYALYVMFYPQLVAGPIERPQNLMHQFYEKHYFEYERITAGLRLMLWGFFKKLVLADRFSVLVNDVYKDPLRYGDKPAMLIVSSIFFAFQIYFDFSAYTDIARGAAKVMGFSLMENFKSPYFSKSIPEFWRRWHISLSTWFKDYVYIPLGGNRCSRPKWYFNLILTFALSGLWHGANWTFVIWGALNGLYMVFSNVTLKFREKFAKVTRLDNIPVFHGILQIGITFFLTCIAWVFFRAQSLSDAVFILTKSFDAFSNTDSINLFLINLGEIFTQYKTEFILIGIIICIQIFGTFVKDVEEVIRKVPTTVRWSAYYIILMTILLLGAFYKQGFIYFQF